MKKELIVPKWVQDKLKLNSTKLEEVSFVGELGADGVVNGKLPNGDDYLWAKRRNTKDTKYKGRRK